MCVCVCVSVCACVLRGGWNVLEGQRVCRGYLICGESVVSLCFVEDACSWRGVCVCEFAWTGCVRVCGIVCVCVCDDESDNGV